MPKSFSVSARQLEEEVAADIVTYCKSISAGHKAPGAMGTSRGPHPTIILVWWSSFLSNHTASTP